MLVCVLCVAASARADVTVDVHLTPQGQALANQMGVSAAELEHRMKDRIDSTLGSDGAALQAFSDAAVLSSHGLGVDYVSVPESLIVGVAGNAAAANGDLRPRQCGGGLRGQHRRRRQGRAVIARATRMPSRAADTMPPA